MWFADACGYHPLINQNLEWQGRSACNAPSDPTPDEDADANAEMQQDAKTKDAPHAIDHGPEAITRPTPEEEQGALF